MEAADPLPPAGAETPLPRGDLTRLLAAWEDGDEAALNTLMAQVYDELNRLAHLYLRAERGGMTLQTQDLVHEAYFRLREQERVHWRNRQQFFRLAARLMRRLLVDHSRRRRAAKRGGGMDLPLTVAAQAADLRPLDALALDQTLCGLERRDPRQCRIVELRVYVGLSIAETAHALGISPMTVKREWALAKAWLARELEPRAAHAF